MSKTTNTSNITKTIILIAGQKRAGKDYIGKIIKKETKGKILSFANTIKDIISVTFGITREELDLYKNQDFRYGIDIFKLQNTYRYEVKTLSFREILQRFGTEAMKPIFGKNIWVKLVKKKIKLSNKDCFIIPDFRFLEEYKGIKKLKYKNYKIITIKVINNNLVKNDKHSSEKSLEDFKFDYILDNTNYKLSKKEIKKFVKGML